MTALRHINLELGTRVRLQGREYAFAGEVTRDGAPLAAERDLSFKDLRTAAYVTLTRATFDVLYADGEIRILRAHEERAGRLEPAAAETQASRWRRLWCEAYDAAPCAKSDAALSDFVTDHVACVDSVRPPPSAAALRTWLRERGTAGDRRTRFMADRRSGRKQPLRMDPLAARVLSEKAEAFYDGLRLNPLAVYCAVRAALEALNAQRTVDGLPRVRPPSESTVRRYLQRHLDYGRATRRYGWREGGRRFDPIRGSVQAAHILDMAVIDQTLIDCAVIDDEHMINVGRPWLAVMIDVKSRYPLGFHLSFEPPSVETVLACLRHAVRPKTQLAQAHPEVNGEWPAFGVPDTLVVDNAWENTGSSMRDACADANISLVYAPVATPEYKGVCERFFGTLNTLLFHRLPGGLPFTPQQRKTLGIGGEGDAALLLSDVRRAIHQCIVEVYGREFHKALQASPEQVWRKDAQTHGRAYVDDLQALDLALAKLAPSDRTLSRAGLTLNDLTYNTPDVLGGLLADLLPRQAPRSAWSGTARVKVKYHPEDLGQVYVWNEVRRRYDTLGCTQPDYAAGLSEHHHKLIRAHAKAEHLAFQSEAERCAARVRLQDLVIPAIPLSKVGDRRRLQRLMGATPPLDAPAGAEAPEYGIAISTMDAREEAETPHRAPAPKRGRSNRRKPRTAITGAAVSPFTDQFPAPELSRASAVELFGEFFDQDAA